MRLCSLISDIDLQKAWGNGGFGTILLTAVAVAANGNVTGSGAEFVQNAAINVARQYTATEIKRVADSFFSVDPVTGERKSNVLSELVRGALHAMASCGGAAATGADCKTAAGAAVVTVAPAHGSFARLNTSSNGEVSPMLCVVTMVLNTSAKR